MMLRDALHKRTRPELWSTQGMLILVWNRTWEVNLNHFQLAFGGMEGSDQRTCLAGCAGIAVVAHNFNNIDVLAQVGVLRSNQHCAPTSQRDVVILPKAIAHEASVVDIVNLLAAFACQNFVRLSECSRKTCHSKTNTPRPMSSSSRRIKLRGTSITSAAAAAMISDHRAAELE